ncbi:MAG TPA: nucleotidyltransferase family protein [Methanocorpusculum sp.]|nr:nucleotidyltransferase family protein [Methanocorpusculum sp.]
MTEYQSIKPAVLTGLSASMPEIRERFGIESLGLFGSVSRGEDTPASDIDILYRFSHPETVDIDTVYHLAQYLQSLFGREVELVSMDYIDPYIADFVKEDAIVFDKSSAEIP